MRFGPILGFWWRTHRRSQGGHLRTGIGGPARRRPLFFAGDAPSRAARVIYHMHQPHNPAAKEESPCDHIRYQNLSV
jgi:hypothetical protein